MIEFLIAGSVMGGMGVLLAAVLAVADKKFYVYEDPRIDAVESLLPKANCAACGECVDVCPYGLFSLHLVSHRLWVACRNLLNGELAEADCEVACTACGRCAADAPVGLIKVVNNLAIVDYTKNRLATQVP